MLTNDVVSFEQPGPELFLMMNDSNNTHGARQTITFCQQSTYLALLYCISFFFFFLFSFTEKVQEVIDNSGRSSPYF